MNTIFRFVAALAVVALFAPSSLEAQGKIRVAIWDFENNTIQILTYSVKQALPLGIVKGSRTIIVIEKFMVGFPDAQEGQDIGRAARG